MRTWIRQRVYDFIDHLSQMKNYTPTTEKTYNINLLEAVKYIDIYEQDDLLVIDLMPYRMHIKDLSKKTIYKKISIFRSFLNYLRDLDVNIKVLNDENVPTQKTLPKPIKSKYIKEAIQKASLEDRVLIELIYSLGLRISEVSNLKCETIQNSWVIIKGKGGKIRQIPLLESTQKLLKEFLEGKKEQVYLFEKDGKRLMPEHLRYRISKVFKDIGLKVTPHQLRHSFATDLLQNGASISDVSSLLGHSSLEATQIYTKLSNNLKIKNYMEAHPLASRSDE